jgi:CheY-like chemotaxis protein
VLETVAASDSVLLVDDDRNDVFLIKGAFERAGFGRAIHSVQTGFEAIAYLNGDPPYEDRNKHPVPALVLLDIRMPGLDGFEVLKWIRSQPAFSQLCVVILTSSGEVGDVTKAYRLGANLFLLKPLDLWNASELFHAVERLLAKNNRPSTVRSLPSTDPFLK